MVDEVESLSTTVILSRLFTAAMIGAMIGYERRMHHKAIGIAGMVMVAAGSATYMMLAIHLTTTDPSAVGRLLQGFSGGIGFLGGAVIFKGGADVRGIKTAAAIWIAGAAGLAIGTAFWMFGVIVGVSTAFVLFFADLQPRGKRETETDDHEKEEERKEEKDEG